MSDMSEDVKVKRLTRKYGVQGYGLYNYILERIVRRLEEESPTPDLEESSHDIASDLQMDTVLVEEIIWFCIEQGLFEQDEVSGRILASKIYKFLETRQTRSERLKSMINAYKSLSATVADSLQLSTLEQTRLEQNRTEESSESQPSKVEKIQHPTLSLPLGKTRWERIVNEYGRATCDSYLDKILRWEDAKKGGKRQYKDYAAACEDWLKRDKVEQELRETEGMIDVSKLGSYRG